jgi:hypothetical protein
MTRLARDSNFKQRIHGHVLAARDARGLHIVVPPGREQGMPDARCTRGLVCKIVRKTRTRAYRAAENIRHSLRNGSTAYDALAPENLDFIVSVALRNLAGRPGRASLTSARLDANPEAVRPTRLCRTLRHRSSTRSEDRSRSLSRPAIPFRARCRRVHRIPSQRSVTMANAPSSGTGWHDS